jgi:hypothetical protein
MEPLLCACGAPASRHTSTIASCRPALAQRLLCGGFRIPRDPSLVNSGAVKASTL